MKSTLLLIAITILISSCSHINDLKKYNLKGETILIEKEVNQNFTEVEIDLGYEHKYKKDKNIFDGIKEIASEIGKGIVGSEVEKKLTNSTNPDSIVAGISDGFMQNMIKFLRIKPSFDIHGDYSFIVNTELKKCKLHTVGSGIYINITATITIYSRDDSKIVWQYETTESSQLKKSSYMPGDNKTLTDVTQLFELASLTEEQIRRAILDASNQVGKEISNTLREDLAEIKSNN